MADEKIWINGMFGKKVTFQNGGSLIKLAVKVDEFKHFADTHANNGYLNIVVQGSKEPRLDEKGNEKLNISLDTWKPKQQQQSSSGGYSAADAPPPLQQPQAFDNGTAGNNNDIPF